MIKTLDKYIIKMFFPPLLMTFFVAMFVLIMQFFWKYVDEIIGKGLELTTIGELVFYLGMTLVPLALPIAILISSVMVMGNVSERYELASMKSAGIPLLRIMAPLIIVCLLLGAVSFLTANYVIPYSNLKFQARLYDIRKQKPALSLQAGVFNDDFKGYTIRIGEKEKDNQHIKDVLIYDQTSNRQQEQIQVLANEGQMYTTADKQFMVLELNDGKQYQNLNPSQSSKKSYPFVRTKFKKWEKVFDMSEFSLSKTDEQLFENHYQMMTGADLLEAIDSLENKMDDYVTTFMNNSKPYFYFRKSQDTIYAQQPMDTTGIEFQDIDQFIDIFPLQRKETIRQKGSTVARRVHEYAYTANSGMTRTEEIMAEHWIWLHRKISFALSCFVFIFIGAPMGAIIRKGGFGWPLLVAIFFFMLFIVLFMTGEKMAEKLVVEPHIGIYLPIYVLLPLSGFLTYKAMNDSKAFNMEVYANFFKKVFRFFSKNTNTQSKDFKVFNEGVAFALEAGELKEKGQTEGVNKLYAQAIEKYKEVLAINKDHSLAESSMGFAFYEIGQYNEAIPWLQKSIIKNPEGSVDFLFLALSYIHLGKIESGLKAKENAFKFGDQSTVDLFAQNLIRLGEQRLRDGNVKSSIEHFEVAIEHISNRDNLNDELAKLAQEVDNTEFSNWLESLT